MAGDVTHEVADRLARLTAELRGRGLAPEVVGRALIERVAGCFAAALGVPGGLGSEGPAGVQVAGLSALPEWQALAGLSWIEVDPVIFGGLLEAALAPAERRRLGAHFTPRAHVERLIRLAVEEPLRADWRRAQAEAEAARERGEPAAARQRVRAFLGALAAVRVLDPACGTGNFLIVAYELLKGLELEARSLSGVCDDEDGALPRVSLSQLIGLDCKPWACEIAGLVLRIAAIRWHVLARGTAPPEGQDGRAVIALQDALLAGEGQAPWPAATFVVGNPPFLGKSRLRACLGADYTRRLRAAYPRVQKSADLVMYWWHRAAELLRVGAIRRFGLVTTNSVTQVYNRRVIARALAGDPPIHLTCAIADHPWDEGPRGAAVRIAMTVAAAGRGPGRRLQVLADGGSSEESGVIGADLRVGVEVASAVRLVANQGLAGAGVMLGGRGFLIGVGDSLGEMEREREIARPIVSGRDLLQRPRGARVIDFTGLSEAEARALAPEAFARVVARVKPQRAGNSRGTRRERYWQFSETMPATRRAIAGLCRYIATPETAKHRVFCFVAGEVVPEHPLLAIGLDDAYYLAVLSSRVHTAWARATGGTLADRPRYNKSVCFETFPFPICEEAARAELARLGEELEAVRGGLMAEGRTVTAMYNAPPAGLSRVHAAIDGAVCVAYGLAPEASEATVLARLVALNHERAAEERAGTVRWLRPGFQGGRGV